MKKELIVRILPSLWNQVEKYSERCNKTIPEIHDEFCADLLENPDWHIPYEINRRVTSYHLKEKFALDFPHVRKSVMVDQNLLNDLAGLAQEKANAKYNNSFKVNFPSVVRMTFYMLMKSKGYKINDSNFYSDRYFLLNYSLDSEEGFLAKMDDLYKKYKRIPTAREYAQVQGSISLSYIKKQFGSYTDAIKFFNSNRADVLLDKKSMSYNKEMTT